MGNPNAGKTTIFNALTGMNQHVGNWPGKTVEKKEGFFRHDGREVRIVDLPGTYSLGAFSPEEAITRDYLLDARPDVVIIVLDAANLERNLFLAVQVLELGVTAVLVLNMMDAAIARGIKIDTAVLSQRLSIPVVTTIARKEQGLAELKTAVLTIAPAVPLL
jgi:ferrous iron transport protein B